MQKLQPEIITTFGRLKPAASKAWDEQDWRAKRADLLTASTIANWAGWTPYEPDMLPLTRFSPNWRNVQVGELLEDDVLTELAARNKSLVIRHNSDGHLYASPEEKGMAATPDAVAWEKPPRLDLGVEDEEVKATIQVKTTIGSWGGCPPPWVQIQAAAEAHILGAPEYCVAWYESDFRSFATFHAKWYSVDDPIIGLGLKYGMTISQVLIDARKRWTFGKKLETEQGFQVGEEGLETIAAYRKIKRLAKRLADREKMLRKRMEMLFTEDGEYHNPGGEKVLLRKTTTSRRFDSKSFREKSPETWEKYRKESKSVSFQV